jgi:hypothetical protein
MVGEQRRGSQTDGTRADDHDGVTGYRHRRPPYLVDVSIK